MTARDEILRAANALFNPGDVVELRIFEAKRGRNTIIAGYFDNFEKLAQAAPSYSGRPGIEGLYWTLNPCVPALLARAANRLKHLKFTTSDRDIRKRAMLLVDSDPVRPSGISATDDEKKRAADVARQIRRHLRQECWPEPFVADSGNGYHLLYPVDLPNDEPSHELIKASLTALASMFDNDAVKIDTTVHNAARICKVYGTVAAKGESTSDRPHRTARLLHVSKPPQIVRRELLEALAAKGPKQSGARNTAQNNGAEKISPSKVEEFLSLAGIGHRGRKWWNGGWKWVLERCWFDPSHTATSVIVSLSADGALGYHCSHNSCAENKWAKFREGVEQKLGHGFQFVDGASSRTSNPRPRAGVPVGAVIRCFKDIVPKPLRWLWPGRIPLGKLTLLIGDPGLGKSLLTADIASRVARTVRDAEIQEAGTFSDGAPCESGSVIFLSAEDDPADTIRPRLDAAGADVSRVHILEAVRVQHTDGSTAEKAFSLETDIVQLESAFERVPDIRLVVIDPLSAYLGGTDSHSNGEIRGLLSPLAAMAARREVAVLAVTHLRKSPGSAVHRTIGSIAFAAAPRAVWAVAPDPGDGERRLLLAVKQNLSAPASGMAFRVVAPDGTARVAWEPGLVKLTANDVLASSEMQEGQSERRAAIEWLRGLLRDGPVAAKKVRSAAGAAGLAWTTVRRAKDALGVTVQKSAYHGGWEWRLEHAHPEDAHPIHSQVSIFEQGTENKKFNSNGPVEGAHPANVSTFGQLELQNLFRVPGENQGEKVSRVEDDDEVRL